MKKTLRAIIWVAVSTTIQADDDKLSLPEQEKDARAIADKHGWHIVDILRVPGHSRRYIDIHECAADMLKEGIDAFSRLIEYWRTHAFDVLIVRDASRFARTQALHAYVVERTIESGASIYSLQDGMIDTQNYRMWTAMAGYAASTEMDRLRRMRSEAILRFAEEGIPKVKLPETHTQVRDPRSGKVIRTEVVPTQRVIYSRLGELLLEGVGWSELGEVAYKRFGIVNPNNGKPFPASILHKRIYSPLFWGHVAVGVYKKGEARESKPWMLDPMYQHEVPPHIKMFYNKLAPVIPDELGAQVRAEIIRRANLERRKWPQMDITPLSGLVVCANCGYRMSVFKDRRQPDRSIVRAIYYRCGNAKNAACINKHFIREEKVISFLNLILTRLTSAHDLNAMSNAFGVNTGALQNQLEFVERSITDLEARIRRIIYKQSEIDDPSIANAFDDVLNDLKTQLNNSKESRMKLTSEIAANDQHKIQFRIDALREIGIEEFWQLPSRQINMHLHDILAGRCVLVADGQPIGLVVPRRKKKK